MAVVGWVISEGWDKELVGSINQSWLLKWRDLFVTFGISAMEIYYFKWSTKFSFAYNEVLIKLDIYRKIYKTYHIEIPWNSWHLINSEFVDIWTTMIFYFFETAESIGDVLEHTSFGCWTKMMNPYQYAPRLFDAVYQFLLYIVFIFTLI